ncbi:hypothetical protein PRIPAC_90112, partial [Pristionchus pacificus]|uniref:Uncharacterized protein n=1 Tax=Pristionchus pacificus TaxID=54126 RepID=A0A2A6CYE9_PRIPA
RSSIFRIFSSKEKGSNLTPLPEKNLDWNSTLQRLSLNNDTLPYQCSLNAWRNADRPSITIRMDTEQHIGASFNRTYLQAQISEDGGEKQQLGPFHCQHELLFAVVAHEDPNRFMERPKKSFFQVGVNVPTHISELHTPDLSQFSDTLICHFRLEEQLTQGHVGRPEE